MIFSLICPLAHAQTVSFVAKWGASGSAEGQFSSPGGIAVDSSGNVYVADDSNFRVQKFDSNGNFLRAWGWGVSDGSAVFQVCTSGCQAGIRGGGDGQFDFFNGIAVDTSGNVFVADRSNNRIQKFDSNGNFLMKWGTNGTAEGQFSVPDDVAVDADGNVYVSDSGNDRIQKFDGNGNFIAMWGQGVSDGSAVFQICTAGCQAGTTGSNAGQFNSPRGLAVDNAGNVFVGDRLNYRVQKFDATGNFVSAWGWGVDDGSAAYQLCTSGCQAGNFGGGAGQFNLPFHTAIAPDGDVYVTDYNNNRVQHFDPNGNFVQAWGWGVDDGSAAFQICSGPCQNGSSGSGDGQFFRPEGVATDSNGNVYVVDGLNNRIQKFSVADNDPPVFSNLSVNPATAAETETVTITFTVSEPLQGNPVVTVNGHMAVFAASTKAAVDYTYDYTVLSNDPVGPADIDISGADLAGNPGALSDPSALTIEAGPAIPVAAWPVLLALGGAGVVAARRWRRLAS